VEGILDKELRRAAYLIGKIVAKDKESLESRPKPSTPASKLSAHKITPTHNRNRPPPVWRITAGRKFERKRHGGKKNPNQENVVIALEIGDGFTSACNTLARPSLGTRNTIFSRR